MGRFLASQGSVISGRAHAAGLGDDMAKLLSDQAKATSESGLEFAHARDWEALARSWMDQVTAYDQCRTLGFDRGCEVKCGSS
jgi:hypothetical protein